MLLLGAACSVSLHSLEGRGCGPQHACPQSLVCRLGQCVGDGGVAPLFDDGGVRWQQSGQGFKSAEAAPGCEASVDAAHGNELSLSLTGKPLRDHALVIVDPAYLSGSDDGHLRGTLRTLALSSPFEGEFSILELTAASGDGVVELYFDPGPHGLGLRSSTQQPAPIWNGFGAATFPAVLSLYELNADTVLDVRWRHNAFLELRVNGTLLNRWTFDAGAMPVGSNVAAGLRLGVPSCSNCLADAQLRFELQGWKLSGDADADLGP